MATDSDSFNRDLYNLLKVRGYNPVPLDSKNQRVSASQDADVIQFDFTKDGEDFGTAWVTVDDAQNIVVYYDSEQQESPSTTTPGVEYDDTWTGLLKHLKKWAQRRQMSFELANKDRLGDDMRQREYYKMKEKLGESWNPMGKTASYNDVVPSVKIIVKHNRSLEEGEARFRNVARIYLENTEGERFLAPTTRPGIAQIYARHLAEGGVPNDERWNHLKGLCEEYTKMAGFVRATRNGQFNESAQALVNEGINHYQSLRETLGKMRGHRGYNAYFESWTPTLMEGEGEDISEMFMSSSLDPRIESAMPILSRLHKPVTEMSEVGSLAEWADDIINEKLDLTENKFVCSAPPKYKPTEFEAKTRDEAAEIAAKKWGINPGKITVQGTDNVVGTDDLEPEGTPTGGTALDRATANAKKPKEPWYKSVANPDDIWALGKLAIGLGEGDVVKGPWQNQEDDDLDDDDSWIPSIDDFEQEEKNKNRKRHADNDLTEMDKERGSRRAFDTARGPDKTGAPIKVKDFAKKALKSLNRGMKGWEKGMHDVDTVKAATKSLSPDQKEKALGAKVGKGSPAELQQKLIKREKNKGVDENFIGMAPQAVAEEEVEEGLDANQKRVGQLGPTEKVKNNNIGKLVGASESTEIDPELARIIEMARFKR